jgi:hypothetical protein
MSTDHSVPWVVTWPNFFIIGAQKAGTTSLYHYLKQHPQVYMSPVKEPYFFNHEIGPGGEVLEEWFGGPDRSPNAKCANLQEYQALFEGVRDEVAVGEASVLYIYVPGTAERIERHAPGAKAITLLRDPADRAYSAFKYASRIGAEPLTDFAQALREEEQRIRDNWHYALHYRRRGLYHAQLERYYAVFGRERMGVWLYEDLKEDPAGVAQSVFGFLGVDDSFVPDTSLMYNPASVPKNEAARLAIRFMNATFPAVGKIIPSAPVVRKIVPSAYRVRQLANRRILTEESPPLDPEVRAELTEGYREDILRLQELIGRDLSAWLNGAQKAGAST